MRIYIHGLEIVRNTTFFTHDEAIIGWVDCRKDFRPLHTVGAFQNCLPAAQATHRQACDQLTKTAIFFSAKNISLIHRTGIFIAARMHESLFALTPVPLLLITVAVFLAL